MGVTLDACGCGSGLRRARCCGLDFGALAPATAGAPLTPLIAEAEAAQAAGDRARAVELCLAVLELAPGSLRTLYLLAHLRLGEGAEAAAEALLGRMVAIDPNGLQPTCELTRLLFRRGNVAAAEHHARNAVRRAPTSPEAHILLGMALTLSERPQPGEVHYRQALALMPARDPILLANLAWSLKCQGRVAEARVLYDESLAARPGETQTLLGYGRMEEAANNLPQAAILLDQALAADPGLPAATLARAVVASRQGEREAALGMLDRMDASIAAGSGVLMEKGRLLDRMGRHAEAFACWTEGKAALRAATGQAYREDDANELARRLRGFFTGGRRAHLPQAPAAPGPQPIFVLGFPRSGTTLVEQTLTAHSQIAAGDELPFIYDAAAMLPRVLSSPLGYPEALAELWMGDQADGLETLRDHYLRRARAIGILRDEPAWFTDKMPLNETHLGLIDMLFPHSPLIHLQRHPLDVVLSVFSNELTHGMFCAYSLESAARHYMLIADLVAHYCGELKLRYLSVRYEDMVENQDATVRRMLDFIGLPFEAACLSFHANRRYARTASYAQVTEPLYERSKYRYRSYLAELAPVIPMLEPTILRLGYRV